MRSAECRMSQVKTLGVNLSAEWVKGPTPNGFGHDDRGWEIADGAKRQDAASTQSGRMPLPRKAARCRFHVYSPFPCAALHGGGWFAEGDERGTCQSRDTEQVPVCSG